MANSVYWLRREPHITPGPDLSGPYALGVASLALYGEFASSILKDVEPQIFACGVVA